MKKFYILSVLSTFLFVGSITAQTTVPNGDFESWTDDHHIPYWDGMNYDGSFLHVHTFSRTSDAHTGNYAAQIETINDPLFGVIPGFAFTGTIDVDPSTLDYTMEFGVPVSGRPSKLKGYYKYLPVNNDTMVVVVGMFKWNVVEQDLDSIGGGLFFYSGNTDTYTSFNVPIQYFSEEEADTMYIVLSASSDTYNAGSVLKVDDLILDYSPSGFTQNKEHIDFKCYPNPADDFVNIEIDEGLSNPEIVFHDVFGKKLVHHKAGNDKIVQIPLSRLPGGIYWVSLLSDSRVMVSQKIWIAH